ncbi:MAG: hypothetical protein ACJART_002051, partial [Maribacter sp.]
NDSLCFVRKIKRKGEIPTQALKSLPNNKEKGRDYRC